MEGNGDRQSRCGEDYAKEKFTGIQNPNFPQLNEAQVKKRNKVTVLASNSGDKDVLNKNLNIEEGKSFESFSSWPDNEELNGIVLEDRKR